MRFQLIPSLFGTNQDVAVDVENTQEKQQNIVNSWEAKVSLFFLCFLCYYFHGRTEDNIMAIYNEFGHIAIDDARIDATCDAYFKWKDLNTYISNNARRGINFPDTISEPMACYALGLLWNKGDEVGDATNPRTGEKVELKATSRFEGDLSSFGPRCSFDDLVFLRLNAYRNMLYIYDLHINSEEFGQYPANSKETIQDQKKQGRRPHVSLQRLFVESQGLLPDVIFDIRRCKVYTPDTAKYQELVEEYR